MRKEDPSDLHEINAWIQRIVESEEEEKTFLQWKQLSQLLNNVN